MAAVVGRPHPAMHVDHTSSHDAHVELERLKWKTPSFVVGTGDGPSRATSTCHVPPVAHSASSTGQCRLHARVRLQPALLHAANAAARPSPSLLREPRPRDEHLRRRNDEHGHHLRRLPPRHARVGALDGVAVALLAVEVVRLLVLYRSQLAQQPLRHEAETAHTRACAGAASRPRGHARAGRRLDLQRQDLWSEEENGVERVGGRAGMGDATAGGISSGQSFAIRRYRTFAVHRAMRLSKQIVYVPGVSTVNLGPCACQCNKWRYVCNRVARDAVGERPISARNWQLYVAFAPFA